MNKQDRPPVFQGRPPKHTDAVDGWGNFAGQVRGSSWFGRDGEFYGTFVKEKEGVFLVLGGQRVGYLDKSRNARSLDGSYLATLRYAGFSIPVTFRAFVLIFVFIITMAVGLRFLAVSDVLSLDLPDNYAFTNDTLSGGEWSFTIDNAVCFLDGDGEALDYVYPGDEGVYTFTAGNYVTMRVVMNISFEEENEAGIDMQYILRMDGELLSPADYTRPEEMALEPIFLEPGQLAEFTVYWKWVDSENDNLIQEGGEYRMNIKLSGRPET